MEQGFVELIISAGLLVKTVMSILALFSVLSWAFILKKWVAFIKVKKVLRNFISRLESGASFDKLFEYASAKKNFATGFELILREGFREYSKLAQTGCADVTVLLDGAERAMHIELAKQQGVMEEHLSFLATVGSISPYIGLFGTVWGIMTSLKALGAAQQATLAMVAPGISEALIATAMGLFAAIPAWMAYNRFTSTTEIVLTRYTILIDECLVFLHRKFYSNTKED